VLELEAARIAIIGLGLMGGSMGAALKAGQACREVVGIARREGTLSRAVELGAIDWGTCDLGKGVPQADMVVLATPVRVIIGHLHRLGPFLRPGCLVMDVGSTKREVVRAMEMLPEGVHCIGGHPMAGRETSGLEALDPRLYVGAVFILTPLERTTEEALGLARSLVVALGSRPLLMDAERHDALVAAVSHLPYMAAVGLMEAAMEVAQADGLTWEIAASGFRDTSRLAATSVQMSLDLLMTNRDNVVREVRHLSLHLEELAQVLEAGDEAALRRLLQAAQKQREGLFR